MDCTILLPFFEASVSYGTEVLSRWFYITGGSCHKYHFCGAKSFCRAKHMFVATNTCLSRQSFCHNKHNFVATTVLSQQAYFCRDKHAFFATEHVFRDKTRACRDKTFVAAILSRQAYFCRDKHAFVATIVAAPANDSSSPPN